MQKPARDNPALKLDNQLCFAIYSAAHALNRTYKPLLEALGLTYPQYLVMLVLWEQDGLSVKEIGQRLHLDSGTLTPLLKRLESAGLLRRVRAATDERQVNIHLSDTGQALYETAQTVPVQMACAMGRPADALLALKADIVNLRDTLNDAADAAA